jgi:hypothetical protein
MTKRSFDIDASNLAAVTAYILRQFDQLSWWPTEGPEQAKEEFRKMQGSPHELQQWCEKWLNGGQWRQLRNALRNNR